MTNARILSIDFESYSECDLKAAGVYKYAEHASTDILACSYSVDGGPVQRWTPGEPYPFGQLGDFTVRAFNSSFERQMWNVVCARRYGWQVLPLERFICTAAMCRVAALAGNLDDAGRMLDIRVKKDRPGHLHMLKMCRPATEVQQLLAPKALLRCHHTPEALQRLREYCDIDVIAEMQIREALPAPDQEDLERYWLSEHINDRGLIIDHRFAEIALAFTGEEKAWFNARIAELTGGAATKLTQNKRLKDWLAANLSPEAWAIFHEYVDGVKKPKLDAAARERALAAADDDPELFEPDQLELIELLDASSKAAVAKYASMLGRATGDDVKRVQGAYVFAGGQQTGRFASRGLQVHNFVRNVPSNASEIMKAVHAEGPEALRGHKDDSGNEIPAIHMLSRLVRPTITGCPYGDYDLVWGDFGQIEARMLPWLSGDPDAADRLRVFAEGGDIYEFTCKAMGLAVYEDVDGTPRITKESRQIGKVTDLAAQYSGAAGSIANMARIYRVSISPAEATGLIEGWRSRNLWAVRFWDKLMGAAYGAVRHPLQDFPAGRVVFTYDPSMFGGIGALLMQLPSGRSIHYPGARIEMVTTAWGERTVGLTAMKASWKPAADATEWPRAQLWKGLLTNNATQGCAADILMDAMARAEATVAPVVGHTHDEIIVQSSTPEETAAKLKASMETPPAWAAGLPLAAKVHYGYRYSVA
jgi:DNA polymerase